MKRILVHNPKGGVGKTIVVALGAEWFLSRGRTVNLVDADGNHSAEEWAANCREEGRDIVTPEGAEIEIVDTKGVPGSAIPFFATSDVILTPFQPYGFDVSEAVDWFLGLGGDVQARVGFIPNRVRAMGLTREQGDGLDQMRTLCERSGAGTLLPGLADRVAVYPNLFNGSARNFFDPAAGGSQSVINARQEAAALFTAVEQMLGL